MKQRILRLKKLLEKKRLDALFISYPANVSYLCGFSTHDSYILASRKKNLLITDARYSTEYRNLLDNDRIHIIEINKTLSYTLKSLKKELGIKRFAFEQEHLTCNHYQKLRALFGKGTIPTNGIVEEMRAIKDATELEKIRKAISITIKAYKFAKRIIKPGMSELQVAAEIERFIRLQGATSASFDIIVASGPHSSLPHAQKTQRKIRKNEPVLIDMGVDYQGYKSDLTRVLFLGKMSAQFKKVFNIVKKAQLEAKKLIRPGTRLDRIDRAARQYISKSGYGDCFKHSLGHGVGLEVHEPPAVVPRNKKYLKAGMVFTIEPAIYLDNNFGVRIEDMVLVTPKGVEVLSAASN
ncbi:M24 family metallopeptidase [Thermoproteota archaeon]